MAENALPPRRGRRPAAKQPQNRYDAAGNGRRISTWRPPSAGPNRVLQNGTRLRDRANDVVRNDWSGESSVQKWNTALIGTGIVPRWADEAISELFGDWGRVCDADNVLDIFGMQALAIRGWLAAGEVFVRRRPRVLGTKLPVPLQIQLIESDFCPMFDALQWAGMPAGHTIKQGIERDRRGQRVAYWMHREHPGDGNVAPTPDQLIRVPAAEIAHIFEPKRAGQLRGVSSLAPVLIRIRSAGDLEDAVIDRQKLANLFTMFITRAMPEDWSDIDIDPETGLPKFYDTDGAPLATLEPGMSQELRPGEDVKFANPPEAGISFPDYIRSTHLGTSAGQGLPYELFSGDIRNVSDRTLRIVVQEFRRYAEQRQWHIVIPMFCQRVVEWFADAAVLSGALPVSKLKAAKRPEHSPHGWDYIHPVQDVQGKIMAIDAGLTSRDAVISSRGDDPRKVDEQRADGKERADKLGLTPEPPAPGGKPAQQQQQPPQNSSDITAVLGAVVQTMGLMQSLMQTLIAAQVAPNRSTQ